MPYRVVKDFEAALCDYTGARYAVTTTSCTMALLLALAWYRKKQGARTINVPKRTYVSVFHSVLHAGHHIKWSDESWSGAYQLSPLPIWDCARRFTSGMYISGQFQCVSFHWNKILGIQQGGVILHDNPEADEWLRKARFDGRTEGLAPKDDNIQFPAWHCYMSPETAAQGLMRLSLLPMFNEDLPNSDYPDLSKMDILG